MREIKYQGYINNPIHGTGCFPVKSINFFPLVVELDLPEGIVAFFEGEVQLREYTGLKDKNGKEIYEGDVVDTVYDGQAFIGVVVYDPSEIGFKATNGKENYGTNFQYLTCCEEVEVIGNIYENPELLKS